MMRFGKAVPLVVLTTFAVLARAAAAQIYDVTVRGSDAIFLAGRTDVTIPPASDPWTGPGTHLIRHGGDTPEEIQETLPPFISVIGGDLIRVLDPAVGGVNFFNGFGPPFFGPAGNGAAGSELTPLDGISGYKGPQGPLTGVFLDNSIPSAGPPPATLDFTPGGLGSDFASLSPELGQVFYIGSGQTSGGAFREITAPVGATRLFFGIPDGFGFGGEPGAYDDNDGSYGIRVGVNVVPSQVPEPSGLLAGAAGVSALLLAAARRRRGPEA